MAGPGPPVPVLPTPVRRYQGRDPRRSGTLCDRFSAPMTLHSARCSADIAAHAVFNAAAMIVDVGGGEGQLLADVLRAHPQAHGVVFDLPDLESAATVRFDRAGLRHRCRF